MSYSIEIGTTDMLFFGWGQTRPTCLLDGILRALLPLEAEANRFASIRNWAAAEDVPMIDAERDGWSEELKERTRGLVAVGGAGSSAGELCVKNADGRFGYLQFDDHFPGAMRVIDRASGHPIDMENVEELIRAGWVMD